jgi:hypothetical protein
MGSNRSFFLSTQARALGETERCAPVAVREAFASHGRADNEIMSRWFFDLGSVHDGFPPPFNQLCLKKKPGGCLRFHRLQKMHAGEPERPSDVRRGIDGD